MAWDAGTITSATPTTALADKIEALFGGSGVANWSLLETVPAGTGAGQSGSASYSYRVWKCAGSSTDANSTGIDLFFFFTIPVTDTGAANNFAVAESYIDIAGNPGDANRGKFKRQAPVSGYSGAGLPTLAPEGASEWFNDTTYYDMADLGGAASNRYCGLHAAPAINTTGFSYYIKLTNDTLWVNSGATISGTSRWGMFVLDSLVTSETDSVPVMSLSPTGGGFTRLPGVSAAVAGAWAARIRPWGAAQALGTTNATNGGDLWQSQAIYGGRLVCGGRAANTSWYQSGGLRGLLPDDYVTFKSGGTVAVGDTFDIGANTYTVIGAILDNADDWVATRAV